MSGRSDAADPTTGGEIEANAMTGRETEADRVAQTLRALELFAGEPTTHAELAVKLGVHPRTARRLVHRLQAEGYLTPPDAQRRHTVTMKLVALAGRIVERTTLVQTAVPYVVQLRNRTGESSHLCVPHEEGAMHLIQESAHNTLIVRSQVGEIAPYTRTAVGKALLAYMPEQFERELQAGLMNVTPTTIVTSDALRAQLERVRTTGWACDDSENDPDLRCVAAPVFDGAGEIAGAIGISAPVSRLARERFDDLGAVVKELAGALSAALGGEVLRSSG